ncbi:MAG: restriction endonuclease subunit S [Dehalococcoidales bacterium]|nr:restriction endonuclease subunit S [Dehalococcoidales bacterium]
MSEWKKCKLGEVADIIGGGTPKTEVPEYWNGLIPWITPRDLSNSKERYILRGERNISEAGLMSSSAKLIPKGSVLLSSRAPVGYLAISDCVVTTNQGFRSLVPLLNRSDTMFLYYLLKTNVDYLISQASGTTFQELAGGVLKELSFIIPPLPEQQAIAGVLSSLDDKIDLLHRQNKTLEAMAETLWRKMFVEDNTNSLPVNLGDIIIINDSKRIPLSSMQREKMKDGLLYPYYGAATIMEYINQYIFDGEYLLLGEDGTVEADNGYPVLQLATGKFWVNNHTHVLQAKKPFSNFLLYIILKNTPITHIITGAVQPKINQENLKALKITSSKDIIVNKLSVILEKYWQKIQLNNNQIRTLSQLRDILLPKLMSGEVMVKI